MAPVDLDVLAQAVEEESRSKNGEEAHYEAHREELLKVLNEGRSSYNRQPLEPRADGGVGLLNQGATCYMNSLLQALFHTAEFRGILYGWSYDPAVNGDAARCIPLQLQKLFAQLELSKASAISTKPLTAAFGFSDAASREQHDVQELCRVLFDALGRSSPALAKDIEGQYAGELVHYLRSREPADDGSLPESSRQEEFLDLQVPIQDCKTLEEALGKMIEPEVLDGDNQWLCEALGRKVDASKGVSFGSLPRILCLQLLRFVFDLQTMRRKKLTEALSIPLEVDLSFLVGAEAGSLRYELCAICLHSGTAHGGHYHAYIKQVVAKSSGEADGGGRWCDANDANVRLIEQEKEQDLFPEREGSKTRAYTSSDAYFLIYRRRPEDSAVTSCGSMPDGLRREIEEENLRLEALQKAYRVHRQLLEVRVYAPTAPQLALRRLAGQQLKGLLGEDEEDVLANVRKLQGVTLNIQKTMTVAQVRERAIDAFLAEANKGDETWPFAMQLAFDAKAETSRSRLRHFDAHTGEARAYLRDDVTIGEALKAKDILGAVAGPLLLDLRDSPQDFEDFVDDMARIVVCKWHLGRQAVALGSTDVAAVVLPYKARADPAPAEESAPPSAAEAVPECKPTADAGNDVFDEPAPMDLFDEPAPKKKATYEDRTPTIGELKAAAARAFGIAEPSTVVLTALTGSHAGEVQRQDSSTLLEVCRDGYGSLGASEVFCLEPSAAAAAAGEESQAAALYQQVKNTAHLGFNHPDRPNYTEEFRVSISKDATLQELKTKMAAVLELDANKLHLARATKAPQLKDETKTLRAAGLADSGHVFLGHGAPCAADESLLRVALFCPSMPAGSKTCDMFSHAAKATASVRSLREALVEPLRRWIDEEHAAGREPPVSSEDLQWKRLRLRDAQAGKQFAILRDERTLRNALMGLGDGRQVAVQVLQADEELCADDLIVQLRPWRYKEGKLHAATDWVLRKTRTLADVREELTARFQGILVQPAEESEAAASEEGGATDEKDSLEIVVVASSGPPLTVARCISLKWQESRLNGLQGEDLEAPMSDFKEIRDGVTFVLRSGLSAKKGPPGEPPKGAGKGPVQPQPPAERPKAKAGKRPGLGAKPTVAAAPARKERALVIDVACPADALSQAPADACGSGGPTVEVAAAA
eukprot:TRINITY_DN38268_c0_g2_i1.p1 TRINITY_DN38268_c0_g2~~TRINITY_DN38268_c0_g2_i1.p1  ORF type:complete len:1161 (+),score=340.66 TRINITY_DN38268_c0_g2_i1:121-3603(+)